MEYPSKLIEKAVEEISKLPGIGKKTALRLALHLLREPVHFTAELAEALNKMREEVQYCKRCANISDSDICNICAGSRRDQSTICVVEDMRDVLAIENTSQYNGLYHVLGGRISPVDGIGPSELTIDLLINRITENNSPVKEIIFALSATMEGDTTAFYLTKKLKEYHIKITTIARGIPVGGELEYADEITLGRSIQARTDYHRE